MSPRISHILKVGLDLIFSRTIGRFVSDRFYLKVRFRLRMGYPLDLKNPKTYSEKLQWLKLYDRQPKYTKMVDKVTAKKFVASVIGPEYIIPTLGVWERARDIDFDILPDRFVLKCNHDSAGVTIIHDKSQLNREEIIKKYKKLLKRDYYRKVREWPYKNVPHKILAEEYIEPSSDKNDLPDYKFFCFNGVVKAMFIATERQNPNEEVKFDFFDEDFNHLPFQQGHDNAKVQPEKPRNFEKMKELASRLSKGIPHVRVDFYEVGTKVFFGEMTFYHFSGTKPFEPKEWDYRFGEWLSLPKQITQ